MAGNFESFTPEASSQVHSGHSGLHEALFHAMRPHGSGQPAEAHTGAIAPASTGDTVAAKAPAEAAPEASKTAALSPADHGDVLDMTPLHVADAGPMAAVAPESAGPVETASAEAPVPDVSAAAPEAAVEAPAPAGDAPVAIPQPIQAAVKAGNPVVFTSAGENQAANRQPDFFLTPEGTYEANPKAQPSPDGSINIQMQSTDARGNQSLRDAIIYENKMQQQAARELIRYFQKDHPGVPVPSWMNSLASAQPNVPDFVPPPQSEPSQSPSAPPENGFVNRGVSGGHHGSAGFAGNGGFDSNGEFKGNGSQGDGSLNSGGYDNAGRALEGGEQVQAKQIFDYLTNNYGLTPVVASGILGNMMTESSMRTDAHNKHEGAIGLCQWEGSRKTDLLHFAAAEHKPATDWHVQVDFMMHEMQGKEHGAYERLIHSHTPAEAAANFDKFFERSAGTSRHERMGNAEHVHQQLASTAKQAGA